MCLRAREPAVDRADVALGGALADLGGEQLPHGRAHQRLGREQVDALVAAPLLVAGDGGEHLALHLPRVGGGVEQRAGGRERLARRGCRAGRWRSFEAPVDQGPEREPVLADALGGLLDVFGRRGGDDLVVLAHGRAAGERAEAQPLQPPQPRHQAVERAGRSRAFADAVSSTRVEGVVGGERGVDVVGAQRGGEARVGGAHRVEVGAGQARDAELGGERVQRGDDRERVPRRAPVERRDAREALRRGLHQPVLLEPAQRLPHRRPAQPEPLAQLLVAQPLPGRERPVDDRVPHRRVRPIAQQIALERRLVGRNWHLKYQYARQGADPLSFSGMRGVDMHVHLPTGDWVCGCVGHYADSIERYFGSRPEPHSVEDLVALYERLDLVGVLLGWDAQGKELDNAEIARICRESAGASSGFGSVDPNREDALERLARFPALGLRGLKLHPTMQEFDPGDDRFLPFFDAAAELGLILLTHAGHERARRGRAGRAGPADRPRAADPARPDRRPAPARCRSCSPTSAGRGTSRPSPWRCTSPTSTSTSRAGSTATCRTRSSREIPRRLRGQFCFGTDYPMFDPEACLSELDRLELPPDVANAVLRDNAAALLGL